MEGTGAGGARDEEDESNRTLPAKSSSPGLASSQSARGSATDATVAARETAAAGGTASSTTAAAGAGAAVAVKSKQQKQAAPVATKRTRLPAKFRSKKPSDMPRLVLGKVTSLGSNG